MIGGIMLGVGSCCFYKRGNAVSLNDIKDNCDDPVCHDTMTNFFNITSQMSENKTNEQTKHVEDSSNHNHEYNPLPPDRRMLGHDAWTLLHTMAVYYNPTKENQQHLLNFLISLSNLYPCKLCALHMRLYIKQNPPKLNTQEEYVVWLSEFHNEISRYVGNTVYPDDYEWNMKRWKTGLAISQNKIDENEDSITAEESMDCEDVSLLDITKNFIKNKLR